MSRGRRMRPRRRVRRRRSASTRRKSTGRSTRRAMAGSISPGSSSTSVLSPENNGVPMTTFQDARAFLLRHRTDYDKAVADFRWPDPVPFNWALDWFDAELARNPESKDRAALWIVDAGSNRESKLSFEALSRRSNQVANFLRAQGLKRGDHLLLLLGNVIPLWETMLAAMKLGVVVIPATTLLTPDELWHTRRRGRAKVVVATQDQVAKFAGLGGDNLIRIVAGATSKQGGWLPYEQAADFRSEE